ncbi:MAG: serine/threonine-protein kinase [Myxococcota bacterium]
MAVDHVPVDPTSTAYGAELAGQTILPAIDLETGAPVLVEREGPRYDGLAELGMGGLGQVLQARDRDIGRRVAIKRMREDRRTHTAFIRFVQEVRTIGRLQHPNIVTIHDVGKEEDGGLFFVMDYVDGESMEAIIARLRAGDRVTHAAWPFPRRVGVLRQVLHAIQFAHDRGVLHRDLKPANIMIGTHGEVRLVDWGVAKQRDDVEVPADDVPTGGPIGHTVAGSLVGTPRYMSPEQARGEPADVRSEVFSLSLVAYEWLSLHHYLDDLDDVDAILTAIATRDIRNPMYLSSPGQSSTPPDLAWFVMDGLHREPERRYASMRDMIDRLDRRDQGELRVQCPSTLQKAALLRAESFLDHHPMLAFAAGLAVPVALGAAGLAVLVVGMAAGAGIATLL